MNDSNITPYVNNSFTFSSQFHTSNFSSILIVFGRFFTYNALGDVDLRFSHIFGKKKANAVEWGNQISLVLILPT